jgi:hypothetical protein
MLFDPTLEIPRYSWKLQRAYMWELALPDIGGLSGLFVSTFCQDVKFGDYGMEEVASLRYGAFRAKYAGEMDIPDLTLTFLRPVPDQVTAFFYAWRQLIITNEGFYNPKGNYARSIYFYLYDTTGAITNKIQLVGCFPKDLPGWEFSYNSEDVSKLSITISVDRMAFGEFVSPIFEQDTVQPFTRVDIQDTQDTSGGVTARARQTIAPPARYTVATGSVPASNFATERSFNLGAVITGVTSLLGSFLPSPIPKPNETPAYTIQGALPDSLVNRASESISWAIPLPTDLALSATRVVASATPIVSSAKTREDWISQIPLSNRGPAIGGGRTMSDAVFSLDPNKLQSYVGGVQPAIQALPF